MKVTLKLLSALSTLLVAACASPEPAPSDPTPRFGGQNQQREIVKPTRVPSVTFTRTPAGEPLHIKLGRDVAFGPGVAVGTTVGYRLYEFPINDPSNPNTVIDLLALSPKDAFHGDSVEVDEAVRRLGKAWVIDFQQPWTDAKPHHGVVTELYEEIRGQTIERSFDLRLFDTTKTNGELVVNFAYEFSPICEPARSSARARAGSRPSGDDPGQSWINAKPTNLPTVTFDTAAGKANFAGEALVNKPILQTDEVVHLHLAVYHGQSASSASPPTKYEALPVNVVRRLQGSIGNDEVKLDTEGQQVSLLQGMTHFWVLSVAEVWTPASNSTPPRPAPIGVLECYEIASGKSVHKKTQYFRE